jgi:hypothetical protein
MSETSSTLPSEFTGRFGARRTADLVEKIEKINSGSKEPLTRFEIQALSQMNKEAVTAMKAQLTVEANTVWDKNADEKTKQNHKDYWSGYAARLQAAIEAYDGKLAQITIGANDDLLKLKKTTEAGNVLGDAARKNAVPVTAAAPATAPTTVAPAVTATVAPETKETTPTIKAFIDRIKNGNLNPVQRVKTDIDAIEKLLAKGDIKKLPDGVDLSKITTRDLQRALKVEADDQLGPVTINALLLIMGVKELYIPTYKWDKNSNNAKPQKTNTVKELSQNNKALEVSREDIDIAIDTLPAEKKTAITPLINEMRKIELSSVEKRKSAIIEIEKLIGVTKPTGKIDKKFLIALEKYAT